MPYLQQSLRSSTCIFVAACLSAELSAEDWREISPKIANVQSLPLTQIEFEQVILAFEKRTFSVFRREKLCLAAILLDKSLECFKEGRETNISLIVHHNSFRCLLHREA